MSGLGFTHVALQVSELDQSAAFYERWAGMKVVDRLQDPKTGNRAARLADGHGGSEIALIQTAAPVDHRLAGMCHLGIQMSDRESVDRVCADASAAGCLSHGPVDSGFPLGYWAFLIDPDGHQVEISFGQNDPAA